MSARSPGMVNARVGFERVPLPSGSEDVGTIVDHELPLTSLSIGGSSRRASKKRSLTLLLLNSTKKFIFLDYKFWLPSKDGHRKRLQRMWRQMPFAASSPFHHSRGRDSGFVLAFEVEWGCICGIDYSNPLCQDGRVVVEAKQVTKREFQTMEDAKRFYHPVNLLPAPTLQQPDLHPWAESPRPRSLAALSSLAPTTAPCSPDDSIRGGTRLASPAHPSGAQSSSWSIEQDSGCVLQQPTSAAKLEQQSKADADHAGTATGSPQHRQPHQSGITRALQDAAPSSPVSRNRSGGSTCRSPDRARVGQLFPADSGSRSEVTADMYTGGGTREASLSPWAHAGSQGGQWEGVSSPAHNPAASKLPAPMIEGRKARDHMSGITMSPQRMPARHFQEFQSCTSGSESKRSVSEPRQRIKRPPLSSPVSQEHDGPQRQLGRHAINQPAQRGRRTVDHLHIASPTYQVTRQQESWYTAEPSLKHARSTSLDGISHSSGHALGRFDVASTSSYGDIVSPGSLFGSSPGEESQYGAWPSPSCWTMASHAYDYRSVAFQFSDLRMPTILRPAIQGDERLLKLYESGLPAWAIYMPLYRLPYRPWMRTVSYCLFVAISIFSMAMGFYDLIKNVPYLHKVLSSLSLPSSAIFAWLDSHVQVRLSILFAYLFGKSQLCMQLLRWLGHAWALLRTGLEPFVSFLGPPLQSAWETLQLFGSSLHMIATAWGVVLRDVLSFFLGRPARALLDFLKAILELIMPVFQLLKLVVTGPFVMIGAAVQWAWGSVRVVWAALLTLVSATRSGWLAMSAVRQGTQSIGDQASWWYLVQADAVEVVRISSLKTFRALQTFVRFFTQICTDIARHRLTLGLRISRNWQALKVRCHSACRVPLLWWTMLLHILVGQASSGSGAQQNSAAGPLSGPVLEEEPVAHFEHAESEVSEGYPEYLPASLPEYAGAWVEGDHVKIE